MKKILIKSTFLLALVAGLLTSCVQEDDTSMPETRIPFFSEKFDMDPSTILEIPGWTNYAEEGNIRWSTKKYDGDGYAQFNTYGGTDVVNIGWLISPAIDITNEPNARFTFRSAQNFVTSENNKLEVFVSSDYDGTNVTAATWTKVQATVANETTISYKFINGGAIDLSPFNENGTVHIGFKVTGSGTNTALDGLFQISDLYVYSPK